MLELNNCVFSDVLLDGFAVIDPETSRSLTTSVEACFSLNCCKQGKQLERPVTLLEIQCSYSKPSRDERRNSPALQRLIRNRPRKYM